MAYILDAGDPLPNEITADNCEGFVCPECGCNDITVEIMPQRTSWFGGNGRARCNHCGASGPLSLIECDEDGNDLPWRPADAMRNGRWFGR